MKSNFTDFSVLFFNFEHNLQTFLCYLLKLWNFSFWMQSRININDFDYHWEVQMLRYIVWNILITFYNFIRLINCWKSILQLNQKIYKYICDQQTLGIYQNASRWIKNFQNFPFWKKAALFQTRPMTLRLAFSRGKTSAKTTPVSVYQLQFGTPARDTYWCHYFRSNEIKGIKSHIMMGSIKPTKSTLLWQ